MGGYLAWHLIVDGVKTESAQGGLKRKYLFLVRFRRDNSYGKCPLLRRGGFRRGRRRKGYAGAKADKARVSVKIPGPNVRHTGRTPSVCASPCYYTPCAFRLQS